MNHKRELQERIDTHNALLRRGAEVLRQAGMPTAADHVLAHCDDSRTAEFMEMAIQFGIEGEREKLAREFAIKRAIERMEDRLAYEVALASIGTSGMTTQGYRTFLG